MNQGQKNLIASGLLIATVVLVAVGTRDFQRRENELKPSPATHQIVIADNKPDPEISRVLNHPLIPGGTSLADLKRRLKKNPQLAAFYKANGFDITCAYDTSLNQNTWAEVSYREGKNILWSKKEMLLLKSENVIEDCNGMIIRSKCGNLIYKQEKAESVYLDDSGDRLDLDDFTTVFRNFEQGWDSTTPDTPVSGIPSPVQPSNGVVSYPYIPSFCCGFVGVPIGKPPVTTPEPGVWIMLLGGLTLIGLRLYRKSK